MSGARRSRGWPRRRRATASGSADLRPTPARRHGAVDRRRDSERSDGDHGPGRSRQSSSPWKAAARVSRVMKGFEPSGSLAATDRAPVAQGRRRQTRRQDRAVQQQPGSQQRTRRLPVGAGVGVSARRHDPRLKPKRLQQGRVAMPARRPLRGAQHHVPERRRRRWRAGAPARPPPHRAPRASRAAPRPGRSRRGPGPSGRRRRPPTAGAARPARPETGCRSWASGFWSRLDRPPHGRPAGRGPAGPPPRPPARRPEPARSSSPSDRPPHGPTPWPE